ncbi:MAG: hypothetical protein QOJ79_2831 [Actinomycetota bacterium]|jgi:hypothetical protein|nr:hypothetical protein [Actinomycetota bacterium]
MTTTYDEPVIEVRSDAYPDVEYADSHDSRRGLADRLPVLPALSPMPTYAGIAITVIGFAVIAYAWGKVAGIADNVALQLPYLVSGGLTGLGLVMVGVTVINVAAKRRDTQLRQQQTQLLADALRELRNTLEQ